MHVGVFFLTRFPYLHSASSCYMFSLSLCSHSNLLYSANDAQGRVFTKASFSVYAKDIRICNITFTNYGHWQLFIVVALTSQGLGFIYKSQIHCSRQLVSRNDCSSLLSVWKHFMPTTQIMFISNICWISIDSQKQPQLYLPTVQYSINVV